MGEDGASASASEPISTVTGGNKPVHRFLRGQPKSIGVMLVMMGVCLFMFGIPMTTPKDMMTDQFSPFFLGVLFCICGLLYILSERNPSKKMITASLALSIVSTFGVIFAVLNISQHISHNRWMLWFRQTHNRTETELLYMTQHYSAVEAMGCVFLCHSLIGGALLIIMTCFARAGLRSSNTQAVVVMRNLPSAE
ncbi:membrane-spanning 4-domains subfamily A member 4D-like isoform X1 [Danio aesculapii]|uniref:membrane-spanning 4-domains subfamily A member 4D-like isoform X1 n=1 Tax=Danio aesculapii TaxID=1142201 RepID=UPI0024C0048E|nr:membrane-spanning 4-domains subfamily A member 4D-like isoform X1 [Danio aesculapii]XP_056326853.1 membrane-spanning 4-domains subfamily A member 4D-like isoform X1 [Danio aesculapii]